MPSLEGGSEATSDGNVQFSDLAQILVLFLAINQFRNTHKVHAGQTLLELRPLYVYFSSSETFPNQLLGWIFDKNQVM
jgi:hypothetical protein